jgi:predicted secreted protein
MEFAGFLATLKGDMAGGSTYVAIAQVRDISGPSIERESIDVSHRDTTNNWRKFKKGFKNGGEVTFDIVFDPDVATHGSGATGLWSDLLDDTTIHTWQLDFAGAGTASFAGFVQNYEPENPFDDAQMASLTIKVDGEPALTH